MAGDTTQFVMGFLAGCADCGLAAGDAVKLAKTAMRAKQAGGWMPWDWDVTKKVLDPTTWTGVAKDVAGMGLAGLGTAAAVGTGGLLLGNHLGQRAGHAVGVATDTGIDVDDIKQEEMVQTLLRNAKLVRQREASLRAERQRGQNRRGSRFM